MSGTAGLTVGALLPLLRSGEVSALEVVRDRLERIDNLDGDLGAFLRTNPEAEREAERIDRLRENGEECGPLAGIPVALKDNILATGMESTCASRILESFRPVRDATAVSLLRRSGAVILGKTNLDEFAMGSSTEHSAFGPTRNPWDRDRVPGGSSGGSAAAVAAGMAPAALGSDTGGSIRQPAAFCGVVGLKPTYGRVSRSGLVAFGSSLDQIGPVAGTVEDSARILQAIAGRDPEDATSSQAPVGNYRAACGDGVSGLRVGLPSEYLGDDPEPEVKGAVLRAAGILTGAGADVEEVSLPHTRYTLPAYYLIATAEASSNLARYDGVRYGSRQDPGEGLAAMYRRTRGSGFGPEVRRRIMLGTFALSAGYRAAFYGKATGGRARIRADFLSRFEAGLDLVLAPVTPSPAFLLEEKSEDPLAMYRSDVYTVPASLAGLPAISVPAGLTGSDLPIGVQFIGPDFREDLVLRAAAVIENAVGPFHPPCADPGSGPA
jgi:aspartyl-tRNA(Asn)/glutamyl-tRNA(Gln) amidotransferase subunit A